MDFEHDFNPDKDDELKKEILPLQANITRINNNRIGMAADGRMTQERFNGVVNSEYRLIKKCDKILKILWDKLFDDEGRLSEMDDKTLLECLKAIGGLRGGAKTFLLKFYAEASKNEMFKHYLEDKSKKNKGKSALDNPEYLNQIIFKLRERISETSKAKEEEDNGREQNNP